MDCSPLGSSVHGIFQVRVLEWGAIAFSRGLNPGLPHCRQSLYHLSHQESASLALKFSGSSFCAFLVSRHNYFIHFYAHVFQVVFLKPVCIGITEILWKTVAVTRQTLVGKVISLPFNMLSRLVITFRPRSKHLLISWLHSPSAVILEPKKIKSIIPIYLPWNDGTRCHDLSFLNVEL